MRVQAEPRFKRRMPCELNIGGGRHSGIVLNVSRGGLFVQSNASLQVGAQVDIDLCPQDRENTIALHTRVVWKRVISRRLTGVTQGGLGLRIEAGSDAYGQLLDSLTGHVSTSRTPDGASPGPNEPEIPVYRVRVALSGGPRSRTLAVRGASEDDARRAALRQAGEGWNVLDLERRDS